MKTFGQVAYESYCGYRGWKSVHGEPLPAWKDVKLDIKTAWMAAAVGVRVAMQNPEMWLKDENDPQSQKL